MGRPTKLTPEIQERILLYLSTGAYLETAASACGIHRDTLHSWLSRGAAAKKGVYHEFSIKAEAAMAKDEIAGAAHLASLSRRTIEKQFDCSNCGCENKVQVPVPGNVQLEATKWRLERKYRQRYGAKIEIQHEAGETVRAGLQRVHEAFEKQQARKKAEASEG